MKKTLGLIDISTILHPIRLSKNEKLFGASIITSIEYLRKSLGLDSVILVRDYGKSRYRLGLYPEYKGQRGLKELTPKEQERMDLMKLWANSLDKFDGLWKTVKIPNVEADDIIGMLYNDLKEEYHIIVVSSDKDMQNIIPHSNLYNLGKGRYFNLEDRKGLSRNQFVTYQVTAGDNIDNIKGLSGEKTAIILSQNFKNFSEMRKFDGNVEDLVGVTSHNKRYVIKALEDIKSDEGWEKLKLNYKLISMFKDTSLLNDIELEEYEKCLAYVREDIEEDFVISDDLYDFLEEYEPELLYYLEEEYV